MCGIIAYLGQKEALPILINGLRRLEYRGYDSAGVAVFDGAKINRVRAVGKIGNLEEKLKMENILSHQTLRRCLPTLKTLFFWMMEKWLKSVKKDRKFLILKPKK